MVLQERTTVDGFVDGMSKDCCVYVNLRERKEPLIVLHQSFKRIHSIISTSMEYTHPHKCIPEEPPLLRAQTTKWYWTPCSHVFPDIDIAPA